MFPGSTMGVSGGGGEPLLALVVEFEAVDGKRFIPSDGMARWFESWC
jgi:hypothetical protein